MRANLLCAACALSLIPVAEADAQRAATQAKPTPLRTLSTRIARYVPLAEGSYDLRQGLIGSMAVAAGATLGVGLYRVTRYSPGEPSARKLRPMEDVDGRQQRIGGVGMSIRF